MKKLILWLLVNCSSLCATAQASYMCQLSISSSTGEGSLCNAVHIGRGQLLSSSHCFPEGRKSITHGVVLANCSGEEFQEFINLNQSPPITKGEFSEDMALLEFRPLIKAHSIRPTKYPAIYFESGRLKNGVECEILALRGSYPTVLLVRIKVNHFHDVRVVRNEQGPAQIIMKNKQGGTLAKGENVIHGDSGGALVCRYTRESKEELLGIIMNFGNDKKSQEVIQNSFSPVFGHYAKLFLKF